VEKKKFRRINTLACRCKFLFYTCSDVDFFVNGGSGKIKNHTPTRATTANTPPTAEIVKEFRIFLPV